MQRLVYDGTTDVSRFLKSFETCRPQLLLVDPGTDEETVFFYFQQALKNATSVPKLGIDGEKYIGPETWLDKQPEAEVDTYEKLVSRLKAKFSKAATRDKEQVLRELQKITFHINEVTVTEFAETWEETIVSLEIDKMWRMELFMQKMPRKIQEEFQRQGHKPRWRSKSWEQLKEALIEADEEIRNPDPIFNRRGSRDIPNLKDADKSAKRVRRIADELAKVKRERDHFREKVHVLREGSKCWANSEDARRPAVSARPGGSGSPLCWNGWDRGQRADTCVPRRSWTEHESLRIATGLDAPPEYLKRKAENEEARKAGVTGKSVGMIEGNSDSGSAEDYSHLTTHLTSGQRLPQQSVRHDLPSLKEPTSAATTKEFAQLSGARESSNDAEHVQRLAVFPAEDSTNCAQQDAEFSEHVEHPDSPVIAKPVPTSSTGPFTHSTAAGYSSDEHDRVEPLVHFAVSRVFVVRRFNQCPLDVKPFLPTLDHTLLESFRTKDRADAPIEENAEVAKEPEVIPEPVTVEKVVPMEAEHAPEPEPTKEEEEESSVHPVEAVKAVKAVPAKDAMEVHSDMFRVGEKTPNLNGYTPHYTFQAFLIKPTDRPPSGLTLVHRLYTSNTTILRLDTMGEKPHHGYKLPYAFPVLFTEPTDTPPPQPKMCHDACAVPTKPHCGRGVVAEGKPCHPWEHRWKGPVTIVRISSKGKLDLQHPEGDIMKGWRTGKVRLYILRD
jgi:hypothetical protein